MVNGMVQIIELYIVIKRSSRFLLINGQKMIFIFMKMILKINFLNHFRNHYFTSSQDNVKENS